LVVQYANSAENSSEEVFLLMHDISGNDQIVFRNYLKGKILLKDYQYEEAWDAVIKGVDFLNSNNKLWTGEVFLFLSELSWYKRDHFAGLIFCEYAIQNLNESGNESSDANTKAVLYKAKHLRRFGNKDYAESLLNEAFNKTKETKTSIDITLLLLEEKLLSYLNAKDEDQIIYYLNEIIKILSDTESEIVNIDRLKGLIDYYLDNNEKSEEHYKKFIDNIKETTNPLWIDEAYFILSELNTTKSNYDLAQELTIKNFFFTQLKISKKKSFEDFIHIDLKDVNQSYIILLGEYLKIISSKVNSGFEINEEDIDKANRIGKKFRKIFLQLIQKREDSNKIELEFVSREYLINYINILNHLYQKEKEKKYIQEAIQTYNYVSGIVSQEQKDAINSDINNINALSKEKYLENCKAQLHYKNISIPLPSKKINELKNIALNRSKNTFDIYAKPNFFKSDFDNTIDQNTVYYINSSDAIFIISGNNIFKKIDVDNVFTNYLKDVKKSISSKSGISNKTIEKLLYLSNTLLQPIHSLLQQVDHLNIVSDGQLSLFPFEVLKTNIYSSSEKYEYLIKSHSISYKVPSKQKTIAEGEITNDSKILALAFSDEKTIINNLGDSRYPELPFSFQELDHIKNIFENVEIKKGLSANALSLIDNRVHNYDIIHLALHGSVDSNNFYNTKIIFNQDSLFGFEILSQKFDSKLIFISACESNSGSYIGGEGVLSLSRYFLIAGSKNTIGGLWSINDSFSSKFVKKFYANLHNGNSIPKALQLAKKSFIGSDINKNPFYWSSYILCN
jgi:CHAT domain-containing protein